MSRLLTQAALFFACSIFVTVTAVQAHEPADAIPALKENAAMPQKALLKQFIGHWQGQCRTWFEPGKLADESAVKGEFVAVLDGRFVQHRYVGAMQGKLRHGEDMLAFNTVTQRFQSAWVDDFHMNYAILFSEGPTTKNGFAVTGYYDVGDQQPQWGWRTEYALLDADHLTITAYNITPAGEDAKAVETIYHRIK